MPTLKQISLAMIAVAAGSIALNAAVAAEQVNPVAFKAALRSNEQALVQMERVQAQIEATKGDGPRDALAAAYESQQLRYVDVMQKQHDTAVQAVLCCGGPRPIKDLVNNEAGMAQLNEFEMLAQRHERRTQELAIRGEKIAPGRQTSFWQPDFDPLRGVSVLLSSAHDFVFPPAHAAIALTVYNACKKNEAGTVNQQACAAAAAKAVIDSNAARQTFNACWAKYENTKPKWWRSVQRAGCTAALVARLA